MQNVNQKHAQLDAQNLHRFFFFVCYSIYLFTLMQKMIKYLKIKNFMSFKDETEINFESSLRWKKDGNVIRLENNDVLMKTSLIYGANASGKTNLLKALYVIKRNVLNKWVVPQIKPFRFDKKTQNQASYSDFVQVIWLVSCWYGQKVPVRLHNTQHRTDEFEDV